MEFDFCVEGGNELMVFEAMKRKFARHGYKLPDIIFWNVNSANSRVNAGNVPVRMSQTGAALVSGCTPAILDMAMGGEISPESIMESAVSSERYAAVGA